MCITDIIALSGRKMNCLLCAKYCSDPYAVTEMEDAAVAATSAERCRRSIENNMIYQRAVQPDGSFCGIVSVPARGAALRGGFNAEIKKGENQIKWVY